MPILESNKPRLWNRWSRMGSHRWAVGLGFTLRKCDSRATHAALLPWLPHPFSALRPQDGVAQKRGEKDHVKLRGWGEALPPVSHAEGEWDFKKQRGRKTSSWKNASLHRCGAVKRRTQRKGIYLLFAQIWHPLPLRLAETVRKNNSLSPLNLELRVEAWYCQGSPRRRACCE